MSEPRQYPQRSYQPPEGSCQIILVRHGQSAPYVVGEKFPMRDGHGDPPLSELGAWQASQVGRRLAGEPITAIYTSTLVRTQQTAAPLAATLGLEPTPIHDLREVFLGEGEGGKFREWLAQDAPIVKQFRSVGDWGVIPGAESGAELARRCSRAVNEIAASHTDELIAVFVHGGVIGALLAHSWGGSAYRHAGSRHTGITHLVVTTDGWVVRSFNDASHIGTITADTQL